MALSVNKVTLLGNLGKDPDYRVTPTGIPVCKFTIATSESFKNNNDQWEERTEWHNVECWRYTAETANKHLKKGTKVYIEGKLKTDSYEKDGITRYSTKIVATELVLIQPKDSAGGGGGNYGGGGNSYSNNNTNYSNNAPSNNQFGGNAPSNNQFGGNAPKPAQQNNDEYSVDMESEAWDDVPF